jgi:hypothetical protein
MLAEIGFLNCQRGLRRQLQAIGDKARHPRMDLVEKPTRDRV